ncbi:hypothetical protein JMJ56_28055 [Belnapia sp. T18]|uniref:DUF4089 domain-containing protein n=1 Tax=Belnapia arida TaxID=2804533 RepID=A0ABS1UAX7_9PROT|nr:hypothetical protein [Belnapia arida]MBL6081843.1 hypothetical protein [Belnapia arida]
MPEDFELDFQSALRVAGVTVPEDRHVIMLDAYRSYRALVAILDEPMSYAEEPAAAPRLAASPRR